jgi:hypothetical protein
VDRRDLLDLSSVGHAVVAWSGRALALAGAVYLALIWWTERFRLTIGRVMVIIAMLAVLLAVIVHLLRTGAKDRPGRVTSAARRRAAKARSSCPGRGDPPDLVPKRTEHPANHLPVPPEESTVCPHFGMPDKSVARHFIYEFSGISRAKPMGPAFFAPDLSVGPRCRPDRPSPRPECHQAQLHVRRRIYK